MYRGNMRKRQNKEEKTNEINSKKRDEIGCFACALLGRVVHCDEKIRAGVESCAVPALLSASRLSSFALDAICHNAHTMNTAPLTDSTAACVVSS